MALIVRAVRNNNPGNLNAGDHWQGLLPRAQMSMEQAAEDRFAVFAAPKWGFRAMARVLLNYQRIHHLSCIGQFIARFAPPSENSTAAYALAVAHAVGVAINTPADFTKPDLLAALCKAIATHECGGWYFHDADLNEGVAMAVMS